MNQTQRRQRALLYGVTALLAACGSAPYTPAVSQQAGESVATAVAQHSDGADMLQDNSSGLLAMMSRDDAQRARQETLYTQEKARKTRQAAQNTDLSRHQLEAQLADMAAQKTPRGMVITFGDVLFDSNQAQLTPDGQTSAAKLARLLEQNPNRNVLVEGFTDSSGSTAHKLELSERRANTVQTALQALGIGRGRVATHGYGENFPVVNNDTAQHRQLNRRVEIILSDENGYVIGR